MCSQCNMIFVIKCEEIILMNKILKNIIMMSLYYFNLGAMEISVITSEVEVVNRESNQNK